jgi:acyl-CoA thioester hydrolase
MACGSTSAGARSGRDRGDPHNPVVASSSPSSIRFRHTLRVYWEDTDAGGVVFYANYLKFFERARTEWLRSLGCGQQRLLEERGVMFVVAQTSLRYLQPARLDDLLDVTVAVQETGRASMVLVQQAIRPLGGNDGVVLAEGSIRIGCVEQGTFKPRRIPNDILQALE